MTDVTSGLPMLGVMGPRSRDLLSAVSPDDFSNAAFPFGASREVEIGYARVRATRLTYVGELGWELYLPAEFAAHVFETLVEAGEAFGLGFAGYHAMNALRLEKGYRHWGHDIGEEDDPVQAGLGFAVAWDKPEGPLGHFVGRDALLRRRAEGTPRRRLVQIAMADTGDAAPLLYRDEPILRDGVPVGATTSGMWGHRVGRSLGMGYVACPEGVSRDWLEAGMWEVEVAWQRHPARVQLAPWYDPKGERIRG